jgi:tRNA(fMet)-specific endonuclease VapC
LIDTNTCIYYIKGKYDLNRKFEKANPDNCFISEITLAELMFGVEKSEEKRKEQKST